MIDMELDASRQEIRRLIDQNLRRRIEAWLWRGLFLGALIYGLGLACLGTGTRPAAAA